MALEQPRQERQPSTNRRASDGATGAPMTMLSPAPVPVRQPRAHGRVASGLGLVALVMVLGMLVALSIGAAVVGATMALRATAS